MSTKKKVGAKTPAADPLGVAESLRRHMRAMVERVPLIEAKNDLILFENTGNGLFVWRAFARLHEAGQAIPPRVLEILAEWAPRIIAADSPKEVAAAMQMAGSGKRHVGPRQSASYERRWRLASEVLRVYKLKGGPLNKCYAAVAKGNGTSVAIVKRAYHDVFTAPLRQQRTRASSPLAAAINEWR